VATSIPLLPLPNDWRTLVRALRNPSAMLLDLSCMAGDIARLRAGPLDLICVNRPDLVHAVLVEQARAFEKMPAVKALRAFTGDGLLVSDGATWARHRRLSAPAFHMQRVAGYQRVVAEVVRDALASWRDGDLLDLERTFKDLSLRIIARALFSVELDAVQVGLGRDIDAALSYVNTLAGVSMFPLGAHMMAGARRGREAIARVDAAVRRIIVERRTVKTQAARPDDLLAMLLDTRDAEGASLSDDEVRDEVITMFVAGHETIATVLTWLFYRLAHEPAVAHTLYHEAAHAPFPVGDAPSFEQLAHLPYALAVCKEALRLYPGGFTIGRRATCALTLGEFPVDAGAWVMVSPYSAHRSAAVFAEPAEFRPERFDADAERSWPRGAWLPFGIGARACIGAQFALIEAHTVVAALARAVRLSDETHGTALVRPMIALSPDRVIRMRVGQVIFQAPPPPSSSRSPLPRPSAATG
jgi:cytochrome P450